MKQLRFVLLIAAIAVLALAAMAQDAPSVTVGEQVSLNGYVVVEQVVSDGPGFIVIHKDNGSGSFGPVIGFRWVNDGVSNNVAVRIDVNEATSTLYAMLHVDTGEVGTYEFGTVEGADGPVVVDGAPLAPAFNAEIVRAYDQYLDGNNVTIANVVASQAGFIVIHSDGGGRPGPVLGYAPVSAGSNSSVVVTLEGEVSRVVFPMLHVDTGEAGVYEFGTVEGADGPVVINGSVATFPITTNMPAVRMMPQVAVHGDGMEMADMAVSVTAETVVSEGAGWLVIHADGGGSPGPVLGQTLVEAGTNWNVTVELSGDVTPIVYPMLHVDTGEAGVYEFGSVEGADGPVRVDDAVLTFPVNIAPFIVYEGTISGTTVTVRTAMIDAQGWLVIHADNAGAPGPVLGYAPLIRGVNNNVVVELSGDITETVFPMLHYDTGEAGVYEFGSVEGADGPVRVAGAVVTGPMTPTAAE